MTKRTKAPGKRKPLKTNKPKDYFVAGIDFEQSLADRICDAHAATATEGEMDALFHGALTGLFLRMENFFPREELLDFLANLPTDEEVSEEASKAITAKDGTFLN